MNNRILIVDDHPAVRMAIRLVLADRGFNVTEAQSGRQALALLESTEPVTVILDIAMPHIDGIQVIRSLMTRRLPVKIVVMSGLSTEHWSARCRRMGAHGFVSKQDDLSELVKAVSMVQANQLYFPTLQQPAPCTDIGDEPELLSRLSKRELMIMQLLLQGLSGKEISRYLELSNKTISTFKRRIYLKLNICTLMDLYELGRRNNLTCTISTSEQLQASFDQLEEL
ncbi:response regulator [Pseudomonas putida]|uniref:response regulator n=1 Tax=Pseudomonas putida TaxID=303 RepID=UPI00383BAFA2